MDEITDKQAYTIKKLERHLGIKFEGKTKSDATKYIGTYLPKHQRTIRGNRDYGVTEKQVSTIKGLEEFFGNTFDGKTKSEATRFIAEYLPRYTKIYGGFIAFYLFKNNMTTDDLRVAHDGTYILPPSAETIIKENNSGYFSIKDMAEYHDSFDNAGSRILDRIEKFGGSAPTITDVDNHIDYLINAFKLTMSQDNAKEWGINYTLQGR